MGVLCKVDTKLVPPGARHLRGTVGVVACHYRRHGKLRPKEWRGDGVVGKVEEVDGVEAGCPSSRKSWAEVDEMLRRCDLGRAQKGAVKDGGGHRERRCEIRREKMLGRSRTRNEPSSETEGSTGTPLL